ncbi:MAG: class I tRNA ligase family protein [Candidatus Wildermuthbacteria bacterium]|nr:class I tRNA ligase family protein [Candidatus Wildermuthbacteria bacterium]
MDANFPKIEEEILEKWKQEKTFEKSVARRKGSPRFVFYEGPPTANGKPGIHHVASRSFKDVVLRYKTMAGFFVPRRAGWDTHGLPVEIAVEKKLGLKSKKDIERYGIEKFNQECKNSVWEYQKEWEDVTRRIGFWVDTKNFYATYQTPFIETLWFIIQTWFKKKLLYKGHKVVPWCARCGTALSSHELAQGYKTLEDQSVYVKFKVKPGQKIGNGVADDRTYILSWTTTPWTLPGNVALAVGENIAYIKYWRIINGKKESCIVAEELYKKEPNPFVPEAEFAGNDVPALGADSERLMGKDLVGLAYEPLFDMKALQNERSHKVYAADFVTTTDGTGVVHTAVMYGEDDYALGKKVGLPQFHTVDERGNFIQEVPGGLGGLFVKAKETEDKIFSHLAESGAFFAVQPYSHEYPHCWRCSTPLMYYAKDSWFVDMQKVKKELLANNKKINWIPGHLKEGRMGEWLREVKDWAFSRERYWGTPLPIWECKECKHQEALGSIKELIARQVPNNTYILMRHGHSGKQETDLMSCWPEKKPFSLTPAGRAQAAKTAKALRKKKIDLIVSSDLLRTKETAEILAKATGAPVLFEERLREVDAGELNGKSVLSISRTWARKEETETEHYLRRFIDPLPGGENWIQVQRRMYEAVRDLEKKHAGKTIVLVSHEAPLTLLEGTLRAMSREEIIELRKKKALGTGEARQTPFADLPYNAAMELDLHRPFIDRVEFPCAACEKGQMQRIKEVADVWFDSGAMPFAQNHWPFAQNPKKLQTTNYKLQAPPDFPADYIVEAIDQTRGWFYTLLAVSTLLGFGPPYKNVISLGHVLDEKGEKMSKSKGNVVDPRDMIEKYGTDTLRWYFFTLSHPEDPKLFSEKDLIQVSRKFISTLWNSFLFYDTYGASVSVKTPQPDSPLDFWILSRLHAVIAAMTKTMNSYDITGSARVLEDFVINDLSLWHIRRSRPRFQNPATKKEFESARSVLGFVLAQVSILSAPFIPFLSEHIYGKLAKQKESVHLESWPKPETRFMKPLLDKEMARARELASKGLALRAVAGIKVRQPLAALKIKDTQKFKKEVLEIIQDELNVKRIITDASLPRDAELDTVITPSLFEEGVVREIIRNVQGMRKDSGYKPKDKAWLYYRCAVPLQELFSRNEKKIRDAGGLTELRKGDRPKEVFDVEKTMSLSSGELWLGMKKV